MSKKDKIQLSIIWGAVFILALAMYIAFHIYTSTPASAAAETYPTETSSHQGRCPDGSYEIGERNGEVICKLEPTGCPWGDSVPMEKCAPPPDIECNADWSYCQPKQPSKTTPDAPKSSNDTNTHVTPKRAPDAPKTTNSGKSDAQVHVPSAKAQETPSEPEQNDARINNEQSEQIANTNENDKPNQDNYAQIAGGSSIIATVLGVIGTIVKRRFF